MTRCKRCGRPLKSEKSIEHGIGPGCEKITLTFNQQILTLEDFEDE